MIRVAIGLIVFVLLAGCGSSCPLDPRVASILSSPEITIYSLHPRGEAELPAGAEKLGGYRVLAKTSIKDAKLRQEVAQAIGESLRHAGVSMAKCFEPRHGVRAGSETFVICFKCNQLSLNGQHLAIDLDGQPMLNRIWKDHELPLAP